MIIILFVALLLVPSVAWSQVNCFSYAGGVLSCDGPRGGNTTTVPFSRSQGIITQSGDGTNSLNPYTIQPSEPSRSYDLDHAIAPLEPLPNLRSEPLDRFDRFDREAPAFLPY